MKQVNNTSILFRRTTVAFALLSALAGQAAIAAVSTNTAGPIHGRQIKMEALPTLSGGAIVGAEMTVTVPTTSDLDDDALVDWKYVWKVDDVDVAAEADAGHISQIPSHVVRAEDAGKKLKLCLRAVAEARSFPDITRYSEPGCTEVELIGLNITDPGTLSVDENALFELSLAATTNSSNPNYTWSLDGGADKDRFAIDSATGLLTMERKDFEAPTDSDTNNTYEVIVKVTDTVTGATDTKTLTVTVVNVIETPVENGVEVVDGAGVAVTGNPLVGTKLHTKVTLNDGKGAQIDRTDATYKWQRNGSAVGQADTWVDIPNANGATYTTTAEDQGYAIRVDVNGK